MYEQEMNEITVNNKTTRPAAVDHHGILHPPVTSCENLPVIDSGLVLEDLSTRSMSWTHYLYHDDNAAKLYPSL